MKKIALLYSLILCFFAGGLLNARETIKDSDRNNAVQFETGGPCFLYSLGYERTLFRNNRVSVIVGLGGSYIPAVPGIIMGYLQPGVLFHFRKSAVELGAAISFINEGSDINFGDKYPGSSNMLLSPRLGYRYHFGKGKWFLKCGITPLIRIGNTQPAYNPEHSSWAERNMLFWLNPIGVGLRF